MGGRSERSAGLRMSGSHGACETSLGLGYLPLPHLNRGLEVPKTFVPLISLDFDGVLNKKDSSVTELVRLSGNRGPNATQLHPAELLEVNQSEDAMFKMERKPRMAGVSGYFNSSQGCAWKKGVAASALFRGHDLPGTYFSSGLAGVAQDMICEI
jgi:hypothetical protein